MIFKKSKEDHTLLNPLHSLTSKNDDQPTNQLASSSANSTKRVAFPNVSSTTVGSVTVDMPSIVEERREEEAEERDDNNIEFSRQTSYNANTERDNVEIQRQPTINGIGLDHLSYTKTLWHESPDSIEIPNIQRSKKKVGSSKTSAAASSRLPLISESPLGFEVGGDDLSNVKPVDKKKSNKKTKVSVDIRESPLGFELVGDGSAVKDIKKTTAVNTRPFERLHNQDDTNVDLFNEVERFLDQSGNVLANWGDKLLGFSSEEEEGSTSSIDMSEKDKEQVTPPLSSSSLTPPSAITDRKVSFVDNLASRAIADIMASETLAERSKYQSFLTLLDEGMIVPQEILDSLVEETDEEDSYVSSTKGVEDLSEEETLIDESMLSGESTLLPKEESIVDDSTRGGYKLQLDLPKMEKKTSRLRLNHIVRLQSLNRMRTRSLRRIATEQGLLRFKASESLVSEESSVEVTLDTKDEIEHVDIVKDKRKNNNKKKSKRSKKGKKKSSRRKRKSKSRLHNQDDTNVDLLNEVERFLDQSGNVLANWGDKLLGFSSEEEEGSTSSIDMFLIL